MVVVPGYDSHGWPVVTIIRGHAIRVGGNKCLLSSVTEGSLKILKSEKAFYCDPFVQASTMT